MKTERNINILPILIFVVAQFLACAPNEKQPVDYVDPFICTQDDHGHWHPSALAPFGLVKLGARYLPGKFKSRWRFRKIGL